MKRSRNLSSRRLAVAAILLGAVGAVLLFTRTGQSQANPAKLTIGIYAPSVEFGTAQQRLQYVQGLAKAIESSTSVKTDAQAFASFDALRRAAPDFAILEGQCYAANASWRVLGNAQIGGSTSRNWALYSSVGPSMGRLQGKKLAYVQTRCNDAGFIDHAMLESEVDSSFFAARVGKPDLTAAVAEVASYKGAEAVFAPAGAHKGLTKVFDTGPVPNPAFVQLNGKLAPALTSKVQSAVTGYGGAGAISGWAAGSRSPYQALSGRMARSVKRGVFAAPDPVRFDSRDVLIDPTTLGDTDLTGIKQHFEEPGDRLD
jgi:hypothetical protein